jgi:ribosomal protein S18 acetylase RimI-like enzyme
MKLVGTLGLSLNKDYHPTNKKKCQSDELYPSKALLETDIQNHAMFVGQGADKVVASVSVDTQHPNAYNTIAWNSETSKPLLIHRLCVVPNKQRQGTGREMLDFIETYAQSQGYDCLRVDVHTGNTAALATYENRGFMRLGEVFFPRREIPFVCMERILTR